MAVVEPTSFVGGVVLDAGMPGWWRGNAGIMRLSWPLARLTVAAQRIVLSPTIPRLFRARTAPREDVRRIDLTILGVRVQADGVPGKGFVFWPVPGQRPAVIDALGSAGYPIPAGS